MAETGIGNATMLWHTTTISHKKKTVLSRFTVLPRGRGAAVFYGAAILVIAASLAALFQLLRRFEADMETNIEGLRSVFSDTGVMATPDDRRIRFSKVEELAAKYRNHPYFGPMTVTKYYGAGERIICPFYLPAFAGDLGAGLPGAEKAQILPAFLRKFPLPARGDRSVQQLALEASGLKLGNIYVRLNQGPLQTVRVVIASLSALLIGAMALFIMQFRRQERVISRTTVELEEKRRELVRLERLALAGQLSSNILHDLKKPVLNIKHEIEEMSDAGSADTAAPLQSQRRIRDQVDLFFGILRDSSLERFVRGEGEREYIDLNEMIGRSLALVRYERGETGVIIKLDPALPPVLAEPVRIIQVFSNLILNAYQAMEGRGVLSVSTTRGGGVAVAEVADNGPGIPPEHMERIFTPFFSTKPAASGTGLGLYICRDIIVEIGGRISAQSVPGNTVFRVEIPTD